jgi:hypothetical protein
LTARVQRETGSGMNLHDILLPVFVQVALIIVLAFVMGARRLAVVRARQVRAGEVSMGERAWPAPAQRASNAFSNQFELPVLFFALVPLVIITRKADLIYVVLSWIFVLSRIVHAGVYVTTNHVPYRFAAYTIGAVALVLLWIEFAIRILSVPLPA